MQPKAAIEPPPFSPDARGAEPAHAAPGAQREKSAAPAAFTGARAGAVSPLLWIGVLAGSDLAALFLAGLGSFWIKSSIDKALDPGLYWELMPFWGLFLVAYALVKLYPGVGMDAVEELRRGSLATTAVYWSLAASTFIFKNDDVYSRAVFFMAWALTLVLVPAGRALMRWCFARRAWWGYPVVVLGAGEAGRMVVRSLQRRPELGLKPVAVFDDGPARAGAVEGVPLAGGLDQAAAARQYGIAYAVVAMPGVSPEQLLQLLEKHANTFPHLIVIPDLFGFSSLHVPVKDLGGILGLELRQQLLLAWPRFFKRALDLLMTAIGLALAAPIILLIAILIKVSARGAVFYGHERIGRSGRHFKAWKFRTMFTNAAQHLDEYLREHPEQREEWERNHKLKDDPRITPVGRWLRRLSLDELPQLWNVFAGEMSLVGPRPIVDAEVGRYEPNLSLYLKVRPGITGLWQVSGRNDTSYPERVALDTYYVRNWSPWLDLHIMSRTVTVVLSGKGAY